MIKTIIGAMYSAFISIVLISIILAGWTCFSFISQPTKSVEIINVVQDIYASQKSVMIDVVQLSKLLISDKNERIVNDENNLLTESELLTNEADKSLLDEPTILEDNIDNPLGIVIEPSSSELNEENQLEIRAIPLDNDRSEISMNEMEIGMDMN